MPARAWSSQVPKGTPYRNLIKSQPTNRRGDQYGPLWPAPPSPAPGPSGARDSTRLASYQGRDERTIPHSEVSRCMSPLGAAEALSPATEPRPVRGTLFAGNFTLERRTAEAACSTSSRFPYMDRCADCYCVV